MFLKLGQSKTPNQNNMKTFKANEMDAAMLKDAASKLKAANAAIAAANKQVEASKQAIAQWLKDNRDTDIDALTIGEFVQIDGIVMIERAKQNKFDEKAFLLEQPAQHAAYKRDFPMNKFKSLIA